MSTASNFSKQIVKQKRLPILLILALIVLIAVIVTLPQIRLMFVSANYQNHSTHIVSDLTADVGKKVKMDVASALFDSNHIKTTNIVYCTGAQQLLFGVVGSKKNVEKVPFDFQLRDSSGQFFDFEVAATGIQKYMGNRLMPFYITNIPLIAGQDYVLQIYNGDVKVGEVTFQFPAK